MYQLPFLESLTLIGCVALGLGLVVVTLCLIWQFLWAPWAQKRWYDWVFVIVVGLALIVASGTLNLIQVSPPWIQGPFTLDSLLSSCWILIPLGILSLPFVFCTLIAKVIFKRNLAAWFSRLLLLVPFVVGAAGYDLILIFAFTGGYRHESQYFKLHAAIKNTCLLDPQREHCPTKLEELSYIEPEEFKRISREADLFYTYDPQDNQYTFIVRYDAKHAVVFDQRLIPSTGADFETYEISTDGQDRLKNPPPYGGPWTLPEWRH